MDDPRFPVGRFARDPEVTGAKRAGWIDEIRRVPEQLRRAVAGLDDAQLDTPYREGGWTVRQLVHHLPDSHVNAYVRTRLALTEDEPDIKTYDEARWAELSDAHGAPVDVSLTLLDALHHRWVLLLDGLGEEDFGRTMRHPEHGAMTLDHLVQLYAWHGRHHVAHVQRLRERMGWGAPG